nr:immunoglobulin light chain junction region [Macaca mulatta]
DYFCCSYRDRSTYIF